MKQQMDDFLPQFDVAERQAVIVNAPVERVYAVAREVNLSQSQLTRWLFRLRGIPARSFTLNYFILCAIAPRTKAFEHKRKLLFNHECRMFGYYGSVSLD